MKKFIINNKIFICLIFCLGLIISGCNKESPLSPELAQSKQVPVLEKAGGTPQISGNYAGATQISGVGFYAEVAECNAASQGADYAVRMSGELEGCVYVFIDEFECSPSGTYREKGREYFVGTFNGGSGTFWMDYKFEARYEGCAPDGAPLGAEIFGRCQHPIIAGSGDGAFNGVTGRLDFKDDIAAGNFPYRGHLRF